jgi:hypothetical protein
MPRSSLCAKPSSVQAIIELVMPACCCPVVQRARVKSSRVAIRQCAARQPRPPKFPRACRRFQTVPAQVDVKNSGGNQSLVTPKISCGFFQCRSAFRYASNCNCTPCSTRTLSSFLPPTCNPSPPHASACPPRPRHKSTRSMRPCSANLCPSPKSISHAGARAWNFRRCPKSSSAADGSNSFCPRSHADDDRDKILQRFRHARARRKRVAPCRAASRREIFHERGGNFATRSRASVGVRSRQRLPSRSPVRREIFSGRRAGNCRVRARPVQKLSARRRASRSGRKT